MTRRQDLAQRRRTLGYSQESLADALGTDRSTVARWERGQCEPQPYIRPKLARLLQVSLADLDNLVSPAENEHHVSSRSGSGHANPIAGHVVPGSESDEDDDMNRRDLLRLLSITGALVALPYAEPAQGQPPDSAMTTEPDPAQYEQLNDHLWQLFALSSSKQLVYPMVRRQLGVLTGDLEQARTMAGHRGVCMATADLFQLAGEIFFDANRYADAASCYSLAVSAAREVGAYDLLASALTRHAFICLYEHRHHEAETLLTVAARAADRGDPQLSTRHWVAAVRANAFAGLGELDACARQLDNAEHVLGLNGPVTRSGWLRFDGSRLAEERGACYLQLGRTGPAENALYQALDQANSPRRRSAVLTDLAMVGLRQGDLDHALRHGYAAAQVAEHTKSAGYVGRKLLSLRDRITPFATDKRVREFIDRIDVVVLDA
ncbi:hypothetical protein GCM10009555_031090 [Acrocarpospora macrocephala]|uniref:Transcriptional regulator n=1 Tax=Acrocarpospora macrocephala TaxID=150177 RepID=A0A5M3WUR8_9ACTN|nr:helix-turn-helix transcriptional regulator [Acrocarpospora macrocephala]GES12440.1 transcriptional regulator [Acrocarpospora macrocephala]